MFAGIAVYSLQMVDGAGSELLVESDYLELRYWIMYCLDNI